MPLSLMPLLKSYSSKICLAKIRHIAQPDEQSVILELWQRGQELRLAISIDARYQYLFLTRQPAPNQVFNSANFSSIISKIQKFALFKNPYWNA